MAQAGRPVDRGRSTLPAARQMDDPARMPAWPEQKGSDRHDSHPRGQPRHRPRRPGGGLAAPIRVRGPRNAPVPSGFACSDPARRPVPGRRTVRTSSSTTCGRAARWGGARALIDGLRDLHPDIPLVLTAPGIELDWVRTEGRHAVTTLVGVHRAVSDFARRSKRRRLARPGRRRRRARDETTTSPCCQRGSMPMRSHVPALCASVSVGAVVCQGQ